MTFGIDTTTQEGREQFKKEYEEICAMVPELFKPEDIVFPHEIPKRISTEPHFRRVWQYYREHVLKSAFANLVQEQQISQEDADAFSKFINLNNIPTVNLFIYAKQGQLKHLEGDEGFEAAKKVLKQLGIYDFELTQKSA
mmetsp:Transcript_1807/g.1253  ORF Transcript_1807/g.1253 Transcript_1807/m.1253 type:complete len:140 (-) Transcript_1807:185-604(-)